MSSTSFGMGRHLTDGVGFPADKSQCVRTLDFPRMVNHWILIDLQGTYRIVEVSIYSRPDCCSPKELNKFDVFVLNDTLRYTLLPTLSTCGIVREPVQVRAKKTISCSNYYMVGKYIKINKTDTSGISACEVEVSAFRRIRKQVLKPCRHTGQCMLGLVCDDGDCSTSACLFQKRQWASRVKSRVSVRQEPSVSRKSVSVTPLSALAMETTAVSPMMMMMVIMMMVVVMMMMMVMVMMMCQQQKCVCDTEVSSRDGDHCSKTMMMVMMMVMMEMMMIMVMMMMMMVVTMMCQQQKCVCDAAVSTRDGDHCSKSYDDGDGDDDGNDGDDDDNGDDDDDGSDDDVSAAEVCL
ncbi:hypothetical protein ACOMHN_005144 [Nucella lapillus]